MKKIIAFLLSIVAMGVLLTGCSNGSGDKMSTFDANKDITIVSREDGSGTRTAFIELFGVEVKNSDGSKKDMTTKEAVIAKQTDVMMTNVSGNKYAIGYISLGSLNETIKALDINGIKATAENVKNGTYTIARPFYLATKGRVTDVAAEFIAFILSKEGQGIIVKNHYIAVSNAPTTFAGKKLAGKIVIAGSSSVTPVMEKLKEAYLKINPDATIEIQQSDSSAGMNGAIEGTCDIGMSSRALKSSELAKLTPTQIALDGIAVIVNKDNSYTNMTKEQVKAIFTGKAVKWSAINK